VELQETRAARRGGSKEKIMRIQHHIVDDVAVVGVVGEILGNGGDLLLTDKINSLRAQGFARVVVDLGAVTYMDSAGLGDLIHAYATTTRAGGMLKLLRPNTRLRDLLTITKLVTVFDTYDDERAALASFSAAA